MTAGSILAGFNRSVTEATAGFEAYLRRPGAVPILIIVLWACAVLPNLPLRAFIYEEGTNAEIARDILTRGDFLQPYVYGIRWHEKPSLLSWLIAGFATVTGGVNEWSARLPTMLSVLITALMVQAVTRRYAGLNASLFAALAFIFCPLLLQKLTIAEPDTLVTVLSFGALVVWWSGVAAGTSDDPALDRLGPSAGGAGDGERPAARGIFRSRRVGLSADRTSLARPAGLGPVHDHAGGGGGGVGRGGLSPRRRNGLDLLCAAERMAAVLQLHHAQYPRHRQSLPGIAAGKPSDPVHSLAVAPSQRAK